jgi:hypothetical protein
MRVALLVQPGFRDRARLVAYVGKLAERHPGAVVVTVGGGPEVYAAEREALRLGLRVAALRCEVPVPHKSIDWRRYDEETDSFDPPYPDAPPPRFVRLYELRPDVPDHADRLWHPEPRQVAAVRGDEAAGTEALRLAAVLSEQVVAFTRDEEWPPGLAAHRVGV